MIMAANCDQIYLIYGIVKQRRIVVRDDRNQHYSVPETYDKKFVLKNKKQQSKIIIFAFFNVNSHGRVLMQIRGRHVTKYWLLLGC